ncbi:MAG: hypothetical protein M0Z57_05125 [Deltaproteobacteria bacterium]|jgi:hypothetical protein|nr:hypothetical protein [Deltaproteobacteria bacterium]MDA8299361.1 hypothetical protein [Deltaproteobacteria bacterium]
MQIIPQIETPVSKNYSVFEEDLIKLLNAVENDPQNGSGTDNSLPQIIIEQNFGFNALLLCRDLKENHKIKTAYAFNMRDKNRISLLSDLITLKQLGLKDIIVFEGVHPLKTEFKSAKPVYDIDILGLGLMLKRGLMNDIKPDLFNFGAVIGASAAVDFLKAKKLIEIGADSFFINYSGINPDEDIIKYIKSNNKKLFLNVKELSIKGSLSDFIKTVDNLGIDGVIIKIADENSNVFTRK